MLPMRYFYQSSLIKVVDCATVDLFFDLGFHICTRARVRLYGISPESKETVETGKASSSLTATDYIYDWFNGTDTAWVRTFKDEVDPQVFYGFIYSSHDLRSCLNDDLIDSGLVSPL